MLEAFKRAVLTARSKQICVREVQMKNSAAGTFSSLTDSFPVKRFEQVLEIYMLPLAASEICMCVTFLIAECGRLRDSGPSVCKCDICETEVLLSTFHRKDTVMTSVHDEY